MTWLSLTSKDECVFHTIYHSLQKHLLSFHTSKVTFGCFSFFLDARGVDTKQSCSQSSFDITLITCTHASSLQYRIWVHLSLVDLQLPSSTFCILILLSSPFLILSAFFYHIFLFVAFLLLLLVWLRSIWENLFPLTINSISNVSARIVVLLRSSDWWLTLPLVQFFFPSLDNMNVHKLVFSFFSFFPLSLMCLPNKASRTRSTSVRSILASFISSCHFSLCVFAMGSATSLVTCRLTRCRSKIEM